MTVIADLLFVSVWKLVAANLLPGFSLRPKYAGVLSKGRDVVLRVDNRQCGSVSADVHRHSPFEMEDLAARL
jgi:hypothetical protein